MRLRKTRNFFDDCGKAFACLVQVSFPHGDGRLTESLIDVRAALPCCKTCSPRKQANPERALADQASAAHGTAFVQAGRDQLTQGRTHRETHIRILYLAANPGNVPQKENPPASA